MKVFKKWDVVTDDSANSILATACDPAHGVCLSDDDDELDQISLSSEMDDQDDSDEFTKTSPNSTTPGKNEENSNLIVQSPEKKPEKPRKRKEISSKTRAKQL